MDGATTLESVLQGAQAFQTHTQPPSSGEGILGPHRGLCCMDA